MKGDGESMNVLSMSGTQSPATQNQLNLLGRQAKGLQGLKHNKFVEQAMKIAFSDASPEEKKALFQNLKQEIAAEGLNVQFRQSEELQKKIKEQAAETNDLDFTQEVNEQGDVSLISKQARQKFEKSIDLNNALNDSLQDINTNSIEF